MKSTNWFDPSLSPELRQKAEHIIDELQLGGAYLRVRFNQKLNQLTFTQDRRVVDIPLVLLERGAWADIRFLFRAVLESAPSHWNLSADRNDWSAFANHVYKT
jgi:hypothetical protein